MRTAIIASIITTTLTFAAHAAFADDYCTLRHWTADTGEEIATVYEYVTCPVTTPNPNATVMPLGAPPQVGNIDPETGEEVVDWHIIPAPLRR